MGLHHSLPNLVRISELARLAGVPAPTIKHYMREGLLPRPQFRTSRNMAYYDAALANRVRTIKSLQQTRFLPLRVIEQILEPPPSAAVRADLSPEQQAELGLLAAERNDVDPDFGASEARVVEAEDIDRLVRAGILEDSPVRALLEAADHELVRAVAEARAEGFHTLVSQRVLHRYAEAVRSFVAAELALLQAYVPGQNDDEIASPESIQRAALITGKILRGLRDKIVADELAGSQG